MIDEELRRILLPALEKVGAAHELKWILEEIIADEAPLERAREIADRRLKGEPLAYILGHWAFRSHEFLVGPGALIPRPETEELVEHALSAVRSREEVRIADLGAGTGCIGLSLALELAPRAIELDLVESSEQALIWIARNRARFKDRLGLAKVRVVPLSWSEWKPQRPLDLLVSNPPYLTSSELGDVEPSVRDYEPGSALVPQDIELHRDASGPYREILEIAETALKPRGEIWLELGIAQPAWILEHARGLEYLDRCELVRDMAGRERFFHAIRA